MDIRIIIRNEVVEHEQFYCEVKPEFEKRLEAFLAQAEEEGLI